jgi:hypothetical protein
MAELKLAIYENHIDIKQLDIVAITSFNSKATNLPGDEMNTWGLRFGVRAQHLGCINCESGYFEAKFGKGLNLSQKIRVIFEAGGGLQDQQEGLGNLYGLVSGKLITHVYEDFSLKSQVQARYFYDGKTANDTKFSVSMRYRLDTNSDVRLSFESHHGNSIYLDWGVYF